MTYRLQSYGNLLRIEDARTGLPVTAPMSWGEATRRVLQMNQAAAPACPIDWRGATDRAVSFAAGLMLGALLALWVIAELR